MNYFRDSKGFICYGSGPNEFAKKNNMTLVSCSISSKKAKRLTLFNFIAFYKNQLIINQLKEIVLKGRKKKSSSNVTIEGHLSIFSLELYEKKKV